MSSQLADSRLQARYEVAADAYLSYVNGKWFVCRYQDTWEVEEFGHPTLLVLARTARNLSSFSQNEFTQIAHECGYSTAQAEALLAELLVLGFIGKVTAGVHSQPDEWPPRQLAQLVNIRRALRWADYSNIQTLGDDRALMSTYCSEEAPPSLYTDHLELDTPEFRRTQVTDKVEALLRLCFSATSLAQFHQHQALLKPVPSIGARHGVEAYYLTRDSGCGALLKHFSVRRGQFVSVRRYTRAMYDCTILLSVVFDRYMWRYRQPHYYYDVLHDLGHARETLLCGGRALGLQLSHCQLPETDLGDNNLDECWMIALAATEATSPVEQDYWALPTACV